MQEMNERASTAGRTDGCVHLKVIRVGTGDRAGPQDRASAGTGKCRVAVRDPSLGVGAIWFIPVVIPMETGLPECSGSAGEAEYRQTALRCATTCSESSEKSFLTFFNSASMAFGLSTPTSKTFTSGLLSAKMASKACRSTATYWTTAILPSSATCMLQAMMPSREAGSIDPGAYSGRIASPFFPDPFR